MRFSGNGQPHPHCLRAVFNQPSKLDMFIMILGLRSTAQYVYNATTGYNTS